MMKRCDEIMGAENIFYNADYLVVEYMDLIKCPFFTLLTQLKKNKMIYEILKVEEIESLSELGLLEWYINRKNQNFFIDLNRYPDDISNEDMDKLLDQQISSSIEFYNQAIPLCMLKPLKIIKAQKLVKEIIIYHPFNNLFGKRSLEEEIGGHLTFMNDFDMVLDKAGSNSTYFLSNIELLLKMKEKKCLQMSTVTLPTEYRYNRKNMTEMKLDLDTLFKENPFKLSYTRAWIDFIQ